MLLIKKASKIALKFGSVDGGTGARIKDVDLDFWFNQSPYCTLTVVYVQITLLCALALLYFENYFEFGI